MKVYVSRFAPGGERDPYLQEFDLDKGKGETLLGLLKYIQEEKDSSISFRYNCRNEHCGECGVSANGKPVLACREIVNSDSLVVKPLARFPVLKDLIVDLNTLLDRLMRNMPPLKSGYSSELEPEVYEQLFLAGRCNSCLLCLSACPLFNSEEEEVAGPAFYVLFAQYLLRPFDKDESFFKTLFKHKFLQCNLCSNCTKFCPQEVDPRQVILTLLSYIQQLKIEVDPNEPLIHSLQKKQRVMK